MKFVAASIFDTKAKFYSAPFFVHNKATAQRAFADIAKTKDHAVGRNPGDYILFIIGEFNDETAEMVHYATPDNCGLAAQYVEV